ncbi:MAG: hypothetical protein V1768_02435 [Patescibacteria group bacterium]
MKKVVKTILLSALYLVIFGFLLAFFIKIFDKIFFQEEADYINNSVGAFMGAFFAFLFIRIGDISTKIYERNKLHHNTLVKIELLFNNYQNIINDNIFIIDKFIEIAEKCISQNQPFVYYNKLHQFPAHKELLLDLRNIDLINEIFTFQIDIDKMNSSMQTATDLYSSMSQALTSGAMNVGAYNVNIKDLIKKYKVLKAYLKALENDNIKIVATIRILLEQKTFSNYFISLPAQRYPKNLKEKVDKEIKKVHGEIEVIREQSQKRINEILSNHEKS